MHLWFTHHVIPKDANLVHPLVYFVGVALVVLLPPAIDVIAKKLAIPVSGTRSQG
jgi:hypothetical protein